MNKEESIEKIIKELKGKPKYAKCVNLRAMAERIYDVEQKLAEEAKKSVAQKIFVLPEKVEEEIKEKKSKK